MISGLLILIVAALATSLIFKPSRAAVTSGWQAGAAQARKEFLDGYERGQRHLNRPDVGRFSHLLSEALATAYGVALTARGAVRVAAAFGRGAAGGYRDHKAASEVVEPEAVRDRPQARRLEKPPAKPSTEPPPAPPPPAVDDTPPAAPPAARPEAAAPASPPHDTATTEGPAVIPSEFTTWQALVEDLTDEVEQMTAASEEASERQEACDGLTGSFISKGMTSAASMIALLSQYQDYCGQLTAIQADMAALAAKMADNATDQVSVVAEAHAAVGGAGNVTDAETYEG
ncbi:hypothetical protein [Nonomuraea basaltis]|uniref:hypothetical protein n=1 Tax=Nonomuraea basaltis TaxID=2495887 RepID=UPI00110C4CCF|nr:hypothetical protein [Nonomuraea basaltis]TMR97508.1 hypothetical protein EJK15_17455 [Nonomuraea basaltis]